ncbi:MAG: DNA polymerase IV [Candidatus Marinimicrobia bacterium]|nr:DNA polymerase IV [Candidatus Neomarinimicrobiota bacterium]
MDAFYASVEQMDHPELKSQPVAVGGDKDRGVVAAASYEARKFGVRSAMSSARAKIKCKNLIFVKPRFDRYRYISGKIKKIFFDYTDLIEPLSLDEAFLDVTKNKKNIPIASDIAFEIRKRIKEEVGLTASAGISINKFIAKVATEINKPNGQKTIHPKRVDEFIDSLPIHKFFGVGKITAKKMNDLGIRFGKDLKNHSENKLVDNFGKTGAHFYKIVRCLNDNPVNPNRIRKSVGAEQTFSKDIDSEGFMLDKLSTIANELERRMVKTSNKGKTITIKIKFSDFTLQTRSKTVDSYISKKEEFFPIIEELLYQKELNKSVRLLGISITNLQRQKETTDLDYDLQMRFNFLPT